MQLGAARRCRRVSHVGVNLMAKQTPASGTRTALVASRTISQDGEVGAALAEIDRLECAMVLELEEKINHGVSAEEIARLRPERIRLAAAIAAARRGTLCTEAPMTGAELELLTTQVANVINEALRQRDEQIKSLELRLTTLEAKPHVKFVGVFESGKTYEAGSRRRIAAACGSAACGRPANRARTTSAGSSR